MEGPSSLSTSPFRQRRRGAHPPGSLRSPRRLLVALALTVVTSLAVATGASAEIITSADDQGRPITFDVRATAVDVEWYASWLRRAAHGDEISNVTIRIVPPEQVAAFCGAGAAACYTNRRTGGTITVPVGRNDHVAQVLLHEYGHHLDTAWAVPGYPELNGTPVWFRLRGMADLVARRQVAFDYSLGWSRSVAEVFAEDYAWIHLPVDYAIEWLTPPDETLRTAMFQELTGAPPPPATQPQPAPAPQPVLITRNGSLGARSTQNVPFGLLGPGRRVTFTATVGSHTRAGVRARADVICNGVRVATQNFGRGNRTRTIDLPNQGPANCQARLVSTSPVRLAFNLSLRLAVAGT